MYGVSYTTKDITLLTLVSAATFIISYCFYRHRKHNAMPTTWRLVGHISKICIYPLKSGNRMEVTTAECTMRGLKQIHENAALYRLLDRGLVVYREDCNEFRTGRTYPQLLKIDVSVCDENHIAINAPTMKTLSIKIPNETQNKRKVKFWKQEELSIIDCGEEASVWFSNYILGETSGLRLGLYYEDKNRDPSKLWKDDFTYYKKLRVSSFGRLNDLSSLLLVNQASVDDLNQHIQDPNDSVSALNFRPNIIVDGGPLLKPFDEDNWDFLKVGSVIICRNVKECTRCMMTTINPHNGIRNKNREPLKTLEKYRMSTGPEKAPIMGINLEVLKPGTINLGDPVFVNS